MRVNFDTDVLLDVKHHKPRGRGSTPYLGLNPCTRCMARGLFHTEVPRTRHACFFHQHSFNTLASSSHLADSTDKWDTQYYPLSVSRSDGNMIVQELFNVRRTVYHLYQTEIKHKRHNVISSLSQTVRPLNLPCRSCCGCTETAGNRHKQKQPPFRLLHLQSRRLHSPS